MVVFATPQCFILLTIRHLSKTPRFQHHVSNQTNTSPNYTSPTKQPPAPTPNFQSTNQPPTPTTHFQLTHFKQHVSNTFITPRETLHHSASNRHHLAPGSQPLHLYPRSSSFNWCSAITPLPPVILLQLVLSHYTLTPGHPPSLGSQPLHPYRRSSSFNWFSAITPLPPVILLQLVLSHYTLTDGHPPSTGVQNR